MAIKHIFRFDEDQYLIIVVNSNKYGTGYYADIPDQIYFQNVIDIPREEERYYQKIPFRKAHYFVKKYVAAYRRIQRYNTDADEVFRKHLEAVNILNYLENDYDAERIQAYIQHEKLWEREAKVLEKHFNELNKIKIKHQQKIQKQKNAEEREQRRIERLEREAKHAQKMEQYNHECKQRLQKYLSTCDKPVQVIRIYSDYHELDGLKGYHIDNDMISSSMSKIMDAYNDYCMCNNY